MQNVPSFVHIHMNKHYIWGGSSSSFTFEPAKTSTVHNKLITYMYKIQLKTGLKGRFSSPIYLIDLRLRLVLFLRDLFMFSYICIKVFDIYIYIYIRLSLSFFYFYWKVRTVCFWCLKKNKKKKKRRLM